MITMQMMDIHSWWIMMVHNDNTFGEWDLIQWFVVMVKSWYIANDHAGLTDWCWLSQQLLLPDFDISGVSWQLSCFLSLMALSESSETMAHTQLKMNESCQWKHRQKPKKYWMLPYVSIWCQCSMLQYLWTHWQGRSILTHHVSIQGRGSTGTPWSRLTTPEEQTQRRRHRATTRRNSWRETRRNNKKMKQET